MMRARKESDFRFFEDFWAGTGPFPIIFAAPHLAKGKNYIEHTLVEQHSDPEILLKEALSEASYNHDRLGDGIPTIRADLGTTLLPSGLGLPIGLSPNQHPWLTDHFSLQDYINKEGHYKCLYVNIEIAQTARSDVPRGMKAILSSLNSANYITFRDIF